MYGDNILGKLFDGEVEESTHRITINNKRTPRKSKKTQYRKRSGKKFRKKLQNKLNDLNLRGSSMNIVETTISALLENAEFTEIECVFRDCFLIGEKLENFQLFNALNISPSRLVHAIMLKSPHANAFLDICFNSFLSETNDEMVYEWLPSNGVCRFLKTAQSVMNKNIFWNFKKQLSTKSTNTVQNIFMNVYLEKPEYPGVNELGTLCSALGAYTKNEKLALLCLEFNGNVSLPYPIIEFLDKFDFYTLNSVLVCLFYFTSRDLCCPACFALRNVYCQEEMIDEDTIGIFLDFFSNYKNLKHEPLDDKTCKVLREMIVKSINNDYSHNLTYENFNKIQRFAKSATIASSGEDITQIVFDDLLAIPLPAESTWTHQSTEITKTLTLADRATKKVAPKGLNLVQVYPLHRCVIATPVKFPGFTHVYFELDFFQYQIIELFNYTEIADFQTIINLFPKTWHAAAKAGLKRLVGIQLLKPISKDNKEALKLQLDKVSVPSSVSTYLLEPGEIVLKLFSLETITQRVKKCIEEFMTTPNDIKAWALDHTIEKAMYMKVFQKSDALNTDSDAVVIHDKLVLKNLRSIIKTSILDKYSEELQKCKAINEIIVLFSSMFSQYSHNIISEDNNVLVVLKSTIYFVPKSEDPWQVTVSIILKYYHGKFLNSFGEAWLEFFEVQNIDPARFMDTSLKILTDILADQNPFLGVFHHDQYLILAQQLTDTLQYNHIDSSEAKLTERLARSFLGVLFDLCKGREYFYKKLLKYCHSSQSEKIHKDNYEFILSRFAIITQHLGDPFFTFYYENYFFKLAIRDNNPQMLKLCSGTPFSTRNKSTENDFRIFSILTDSIRTQTPLNEGQVQYLKRCDDFQNWALSSGNRVLCLNMHRDTFPKNILQNHDGNLENCLPADHTLARLTETANEVWSSKYNAQDKRSITKMYELSHGVIGTPYKMPNNEFLNLHVNFFQYMILDCYQERDAFSLEELLQKTKLQLKDVVPALQSFIKVNMVKQTAKDRTTIFELNLDPGTLKINTNSLQEGNVMKLPYRAQASVRRGTNIDNPTNNFKKLKLTNPNS
ncbi:hypothetical protein ACO0QE_004038 [Hanseniaspora vineae]